MGQERCGGLAKRAQSVIGLVAVGLFLLSSGAAYAAGGASNLTIPTQAARSSDSAPPAVMPVVPPPSPEAKAAYVLGVGDRIKLTVYGEEDLSGEYEISSTGIVAVPLVGEVKALGQTLADFEKAVRSKLSEGYLRDPKVNAQVINYRPFFILGEVSKPGSYPYVNGMTVLNAVAMAGGYTYRADKSDIRVTHAAENDKKEQPIKEDATVVPGDILRVPERFF